jgi:hypothetical protein
MIKKLFNNFNMHQFEKNGTIFGGIGKDGIWRTCRLKAKSDNDKISDGTVKAILISLQFKGVKDLNYFISK